MIHFYRLIPIVFLLGLPLLGFSQKYWEMGLGLGTSNYLGDLVEPVVAFAEPHFAAQANLRRCFDGQHSLKINALYGKISGNDQNYERNAVRGTSFQGNLFELAVLGEVGFWQPRRMEKKLKLAKVVFPYLLVGVSTAYSDPQVTYTDSDNEDAATDYLNLHFGVPLGIGVRAAVGEKISLGLECAIRLTLSDYLDGVQATGNAYKNDTYNFLGLTLGYRFDDKAKPAATPTSQH